MQFVQKSIVWIRGLLKCSKLLSLSILVLVSTAISGCDDYPVSTEVVFHAAGKAGLHTPVERNTQGNIFGYYEYLPQDFDEKSDKLYPIIFYWNGKNTISGNGKSELGGVLNQGLAEYINKGRHYPAIIITGQLFYGDWENIDIQPFVQYILNRYSHKIDVDKVLMTGFSAGGGVTIRYATNYPGVLAAIAPVSAAIRYPDEKDPAQSIAKLSTWFFHNKGDDVVKPERSIQWHEVLKAHGGDHHLTLYDDEGHYAWYKAYDEKKLWEWLMSRSRKSAL